MKIKSSDEQYQIRHEMNVQSLESVLARMKSEKIEPGKTWEDCLPLYEIAAAIGKLNDLVD